MAPMVLVRHSTRKAQVPPVFKHFLHSNENGSLCLLAQPSNGTIAIYEKYNVWLFSQLRAGTTEKSTFLILSATFKNNTPCLQVSRGQKKIAQGFFSNVQISHKLFIIIFTLRISHLIHKHYLWRVKISHAANCKKFLQRNSFREFSEDEKTYNSQRNIMLAKRIFHWLGTACSFGKLLSETNVHNEKKYTYEERKSTFICCCFP